MSKLRENSIFYKPPTREERLQDLKYFFLFWKGRKKGIIHTRDITLDDFRYIFFPKGFHEIYGYLGSVPYENDIDVFKTIAYAFFSLYRTNEFDDEELELEFQRILNNIIQSLLPKTEWDIEFDEQGKISLAT